MFSRKVKFTFPHIDNKEDIDNANIELEKNISASTLQVKDYLDQTWKIE